MQNEVTDSLQAAFELSHLHFSTKASGEYVPSIVSEWSGSTSLGILIAVSCLTMIAVLPHLVQILPLLPACLTKWKESVNLSNSAGLSRRRNISALAMIVPFLLICSYYDIYPFVQDMGIWGNMAVTTGIFVVYLLSRKGCQLAFKSRTVSDTVWKSAVQTPYTFFIICTFVMSVTVGICKLCGIEDGTVRALLYWIAAVTYAVCLIRKTQIFAFNGGIMSGILYLCTLELVPAAILALPSIF